MSYSRQICPASLGNRLIVLVTLVIVAVRASCCWSCWRLSGELLAGVSGFADDPFDSLVGVLAVVVPGGFGSGKRSVVADPDLSTDPKLGRHGAGLVRPVSSVCSAVVPDWANRLSAEKLHSVKHNETMVKARKTRDRFSTTD